MFQVDTQLEHYEKFYAKGGWRYWTWKERWFMRKRIVEPLQLTKGSRVLELGCGMGFHSHVLHQLGFEVVGVDRSESGIRYAKSHFSGPTYYSHDAADLVSIVDPESFDVVYVRGMSWYHYELNEVNKHGVDVPAATREFFRFLKPGGLFVLQIKTDFSGSKTQDDVHHNKFQDYVDLFTPLGEVAHISDFKGRILTSPEDAARSKRSIVIATRKPSSFAA